MNDLLDTVASSMYLFADDAKLSRTIASQRDHDIMQSDLDNMQEWAEMWLLHFHPQKCKSMTLKLNGRPVQESTYSIADKPIGNSAEEKDLGVLVDDRLSLDNHIRSIAGRGNRIAGVIRRSYCHLSESNFPLLFKALVRPHGEYAQAAWHPYKMSHIDCIEKVQRRASKLTRLKMTTLIEVFKILHKKYDSRACQGILHLDTNTRTRGHAYKLKKFQCNREIRLHSFGHRVVNPWNSLPSQVVEAPSLDAFERRIDKHWMSHPMKLDPRAPALQQ